MSIEAKPAGFLIMLQYKDSPSKPSVILKGSVSSAIHYPTTQTKTVIQFMKFSIIDIYVEYHGFLTRTPMDIL